MTRRATRDDLDTILRLEETSFRSDRMKRESLRRLLASPTALFLVEEEDGVVLGYVLLLLRSASRRARLYSVAVDPDARRHGVGRGLVEAAEKAARELGLEEIRLEIRSDNEASKRLFSSRGYEPFRTIEDYYEDGMNAVRYRKRLDAGRGGT